MPLVPIILIALGLLVVGSTTALAASKKDDELENWNEFDSLFKKYASLYGINWKWLKAIALNESTLNNNKLVKQGLASTDGKSYGIMQLTIPTASDMYGKTVTPSQLNNPEFSIMYAAKYVGRLAKMFSFDEQKTIISYNQGQGNTKKGNDFTGDYYPRFKRWLSKINERDV